MYKVVIELEFNEEPTRADVKEAIESDNFWFELTSPSMSVEDKYKSVLNNNADYFSI